MGDFHLPGPKWKASLDVKTLLGSNEDDGNGSYLHHAGHCSEYFTYINS